MTYSNPAFDIGNAAVLAVTPSGSWVPVEEFLRVHEVRLKNLERRGVRVVGLTATLERLSKLADGRISVRRIEFADHSALFLAVVESAPILECWWIGPEAKELDASAP